MVPLDPTLLDRFASNPSHLVVVVVAGFLTSALIELAKAMAFSKRRREDDEHREYTRCRWKEVDQDWMRRYECQADCDNDLRKGK